MLRFSSLAWKTLVQAMPSCGWNVQFQKISIPSLGRLTEIPMGRGVSKTKFLQESRKQHQNIQRGGNLKLKRGFHGRGMNIQVVPLLLSLLSATVNKPQGKNGCVKSWGQDMYQRRADRLGQRVWIMCCSHTAKIWLAYVRSIDNTLSTFRICVMSCRNVYLAFWK